MSDDTDPTVGKGPGFLIAIVVIAASFGALVTAGALMGKMTWPTALAFDLGILGLAAWRLLTVTWAKTP